jgi:hypothetical protein
MKIASPLVLAMALSLSAGLASAAGANAEAVAANGPPIEMSVAQTIEMTVEGHDFEISLYDNPSVQALLKALPQTITVTRWGDGEYYGAISAKIPADGEKQVFFERGEVALWPNGNAFCIFFNKTPVSSDDRPKMDSPGIPLGKITKGDIGAFKSMGRTIKLELKQAQSS